MIVLKIILFILLAIFGIILLILFLPVQIECSFISEKVKYRLKYAFINFYDSDGGGLLNTQKNEDVSSKQKKSKPLKQFGGAAENDNVKTSSNSSEEISKASSEKTQGNSNQKMKTEVQDSAEKTEKKEENENSKSEENENTSKKTLGDKVGFIMDIWRSAKRPVRRIFKGIHITEIYIDFMIADEDAYKCALKYGRIGGAVYHILASAGNIFTTKYKTIDVTAGFAEEKSRWDAGCKVTFLPITAVISGIWFGITYIFRIYLPGKRNKKKSAEEQKTQPQGRM